jgi:hypothetical protein
LTQHRTCVPGVKRRVLHRGAARTLAREWVRCRQHLVKARQRTGQGKRPSRVVASGARPDSGSGPRRLCLRVR